MASQTEKCCNVDVLMYVLLLLSPVCADFCFIFGNEFRLIFIALPLLVNSRLSAANEMTLCMIIESGFISFSYLLNSSHTDFKIRTDSLRQWVIWSNGREKTHTHSHSRRVTSKNPQNHAISQHIANLENEHLASQCALCIVLYCIVFNCESNREQEREGEC